MNLNTQQVESWFSNLIGDRNIRKTTPIDIEQIANIVATVGTDFEWKKALSEGTTRKTFLDIGILRLPNKEDPVIKVRNQKHFLDVACLQLDKGLRLPGAVVQVISNPARGNSDDQEERPTYNQQKWDWRR